jgi:predicted Zn-dependent protease
MKYDDQHPMSKTLSKAAALLLLPLFAGCGQSGGGGVALPPGMTLGSLIGGKTGELADAGGKGLSALSMSEADEDEMGRSVAIAATNQWPLYDNPALTKYVTMVGLTLADATSNPSGNWVFGILDTPDLGAYSGPNGYILITRGAIAAMQDESELAGVIAHEMAHVLNHDGLSAVKSAKLSEAGLQGLSAADQKLAAFSQGSDFLVNTVFKSGWSKGQETAADTGAVKILKAAGYDANGLARFLKRMEQAHGGSGKPFGTHPGTADRVARITAQAGPARPDGTHAARFARAKAAANL